MKSNRVAALLVAAGMSSRMKAFKPLLEINGKTLIETSIATLRSVGVNEILVVTGYHAAELEAVLAEIGVNYIRNENYAETAMFDSARLGFAELREKCEALFFLPADVPLFSPHSLRMMLKEKADKGASIVHPRYKGKRGHPLLIADTCFLSILEHDGNDGLRGALDSITDSVSEIELPDPGLVMDADTPEDYKRMCEYGERMEIPSAELCAQIQNWLGMQQHTKNHCAKVAEVARELTVGLIYAGHLLNISLVEAGALLHDVAKGRKGHASIGGEWLEQLNYPAVGRVVAAHTDLPENAVEALDERAIVYLADMLVNEDRCITIEEKLEIALERYKENEVAKAAVLKRITTAICILESIRKIVKSTENDSHRSSVLFLRGRQAQ
ncbi:MAG: DVU_1551 family NTP transferase [Clostridia bacterium]